MTPVSTDQICEFLSRKLEIDDFDDYPGAVNGLQVGNRGTVRKLAAAVDACEFTINAAVACGADLLIVHHGLFWNGLTPLTGSNLRKARALIEGDLALYSVHLPLDAHPQLGNNALLSMALFGDAGVPFFEMKGRQIGRLVRSALDRGELKRRLEEEVGAPVLLAPGGSATVGNVAVISGGAGSEVLAVAAAGADTLITGEGPHWSYTAAEEAGINLFLAGHYATETYGVRAVANEAAREFGLPWEFVDHPTGL